MNITLTQIVKTKPEEETKPLVLDASDITIFSRKGKTYVKKHYPVSREYIVKETEDEINDMIENAYSKEHQYIEPQYDFNRDLSITVKLTYDRYGKIQYGSNGYDYTYFTDDFLVVVKDNIIIKQISIHKIIDISYNKKEEE